MTEQTQQTEQTEQSGQQTDQPLAGTTVAFLVAAEGIEQVELTEPWKAVQAAGGTPRLLSPDNGQVQAFNHLDKGDTFDVDEIVAEADPASYDALVLPGGVANPDALRTDKGAVDFVRTFVVDGNLITSRKPDDLPAFNDRLIETLSAG